MQSSSPTLLPSPLTEWLVPYAQTIAHDCFTLFAFKGRNARCRKTIVFEAHSGLKEAGENVWTCHNTRAIDPFQGFKPTSQIIQNHLSSLKHYYKMPATGRNVVRFQPTSLHASCAHDTSLQKSVECSVCSKVISRKADLPRHMRTHAENKDDLYVLFLY
jgi:hypothetical protein